MKVNPFLSLGGLGVLAVAPFVRFTAPSPQTIISQNRFHLPFFTVRYAENHSR
jgi:hypothetical protein